MSVYLCLLVITVARSLHAQLTESSTTQWLSSTKADLETPVSTGVTLPTFPSSPLTPSSLVAHKYISLGTLSSYLQAPLNIRVGLMFPLDNYVSTLAYENNAGAVPIALDRVYRDQLFPPGTNFTFVWKFGNCVESLAMGYAFELVRDEDVDVIFAPPCIEGNCCGSLNVYQLPFSCVNGRSYWHVLQPTSRSVGLLLRQ